MKEIKIYSIKFKLAITKPNNILTKEKPKIKINKRKSSFLLIKLTASGFKEIFKKLIHFLVLINGSF